MEKSKSKTNVNSLFIIRIHIARERLVQEDLDNLCNRKLQLHNPVLVSGFAEEDPEPSTRSRVTNVSSASTFRKIRLSLCRE